MKKRRILYIVSRLIRGGPSRQLYYIIRNLPAHEFIASVLTLSPESSRSLLTTYQNAGIQVESLALSRVTGLMTGRRALKRYIRECCPDIIHTQGIRPDILASKVVETLPRVATIRNYAWIDYPMKFGRFRGSVMAWQHLRALRRIEYPVACSASVAEAVKNHYLDVTVVQNGVDTCAQHLLSISAKLSLREKLDLPLDAKIFVSVGSLLARKDPLTAIDVFSSPQESPSCERVLLLLGDGPLRQRCVEKANAITNTDIRILGEVDNVAEYMQASDWFISASHSEGLPNTVLEALACGLPCCLSDIAPHRELVRRDSSVASFFPIGRPDAAAESLGTLIQRSDDSLRMRARSLVEAHYGANGMSQQYQDLYHTILSSSR